MALKRSPGPYIVRQFSDGALIEDCDGQVLAEALAGPGDDRLASIEFLEGNARLLASSWDLLRALQMATGVLMLGPSWQGDRDKLIASLRAAIGKAHGQDSEMVLLADPKVMTPAELRDYHEQLKRDAEEHDQE